MDKESEMRQKVEEIAFLVELFVYFDIYGQIGWSCDQKGQVTLKYNRIGSQESATYSWCCTNNFFLSLFTNSRLINYLVRLQDLRFVTIAVYGSMGDIDIFAFNSQNNGKIVTFLL